MRREEVVNMDRELHTSIALNPLSICGGRLVSAWPTGAVGIAGMIFESRQVGEGIWDIYASKRVIAKGPHRPLLTVPTCDWIKHGAFSDTPGICLRLISVTCTSWGLISVKFRLSRWRRRRGSNLNFQFPSAPHAKPEDHKE